MSPTFEIASPWKFSFFSFSSYSAVARERETSTKVLRAFAAGSAVFRTRKNAGPSWNAGPSVKRRFANGRRERRVSFRL